MKITNGRAAPPMVGEEWREFTRPPLYLLLALGLLLIGLAYQVRGGANLSVDVGKVEDTPYVVHFQRPESNTQFDYRWSGDRSWLEVPGIGRNQPLLLTLRLAGYRPEGYTPAVVTITVGGQPLAVFTPSAAASVYTTAIPAALNNRDTLQVYLDSTYFSTKDDPRKLGVALDMVRLSPDPNPAARSNALAGLVRPPNDVTAWLLLSLLLLYLSLRHLRVDGQAAVALAAALMLGVAALIAFDRLDLTMFALPLLVVMLCVYAMAVLLTPLVAVTLTALKAAPTANALRSLMLIFLAAFAIRAGGMMHPHFTFIDQGFRSHQVQELVADPADFWDKYQRVSTADESGGARGESFSMLGQWHLQVPFPYPPVAYYIFAPFGIIWSAAADTEKLATACDTTLAALAATVAFALYAIAKRGLGSGRAGIIAAAITLFAPVSYLHFSDGNWPYIWGGWLAVVYLMAVICLADRASRPLPFAILSLLAALTLTSHTAIALFTVVFAALTTIIVLLMRRQGGFGFALWPLLGSFLVGAALSLVYYGAYVGPLVSVTLPAIIAHLGSGLGQNPQYLPTPLLTGFWPQVWALFTGWPLLLAGVGLALALLKPKPATAITPQEGIRRLCLAISIGWALVFVLFSIADLKVNLLQRHMLFALPLLGLLSGLALVRLMHWGTRLSQRSLVAPGAVGGSPYRSVLLEVLKREWFGWAVTIALVGFLFLIGWEQWLDRVLHYVLPPGTG